MNRDFLQFCAFLAFILVVSAAAIIIPMNAYNNYACKNYEKVTGKQTVFMQFDSCYVMTAAGFQRWDEYKLRSITNEAK